MEKLKSRKFWIAIIIIAYGAIMGVRALSVGDTITTVICVTASIVAGIAYMFAQALVDETEKEIEGAASEDNKGDESDE